ncbi:MAG: hypothetical protein ACM32O_03720 [Clostridia bacterium]
MNLFENEESVRWMRFLSRFAVIPAIATATLVVSLAAVIKMYGTTPVDSQFLSAATSNLAPLRVLGFSQIFLWFSIGGLLLAFAAMYKPYAPIRSRFLSACGIGMTIAGTGGIMNISLTEQMVYGYAGSEAGQVAMLLMQPSLGQVIEAHLKTGELLSGIGLLLVYSIGISTSVLPLWLNRWIGLSGLYALLLILLRLSGIDVPFVAIPIYVVFFAFSLYLAIAIAIRRFLRANSASHLKL